MLLNPPSQGFASFCVWQVGLFAWKALPAGYEGCCPSPPEHPLPLRKSCLTAVLEGMWIAHRRLSRRGCERRVVRGQRLRVRLLCMYVFSRFPLQPHISFPQTSLNSKLLHVSARPAEILSECTVPALLLVGTPSAHPAALCVFPGPHRGAELG